MSEIFNVYCDESCHLENDHKKYMFLGSTSVAYNQVKLHTDYINNLKKKHHFYAEIKWSTVSKSKLRFYLCLAYLVFPQRSRISVRCSIESGILIVSTRFCSVIL